MGRLEQKSIHVKIIVGAGCLVAALNLIDPASFIAKKAKENKAAAAKSAVFAKPSATKLSWFDKFFCRGYSAAAFCSKESRHPKADQIALSEKYSPSPESKRINAYTLSN